MQRQRRIDIQLYKEVAVEKKRREINLVYGWKLNFWPFFRRLHTISEKRLLKQGKSYSDDSQTMQFASSRWYSVYRPKLTVKPVIIFIPKHGRQTIYSLYKTLKIYPYKLNSALKSHFPFQMNNNNNNNNNNLYSAIQLPIHSARQCENNSPIVFLTPWKQWSAVCILYCSPIYTLRIIRT